MAACPVPELCGSAIPASLCLIAYTSAGQVFTACGQPNRFVFCADGGGRVRSASFADRRLLAGWETSMVRPVRFDLMGVDRELNVYASVSEAAAAA
jgi:hypothetical protein